MKPIGMHNYYVYITTNVTKTVLYMGVTNELRRRLFSREKEIKGWTRAKKELLIKELNPEFSFLNDEI